MESPGCPTWAGAEGDYPQPGGDVGGITRMTHLGLKGTIPSQGEM